jgi:hypothetical protein
MCEIMKRFIVFVLICFGCDEGMSFHHSCARRKLSVLGILPTLSYRLYNTPNDVSMNEMNNDDENVRKNIEKGGASTTRDVGNKKSNKMNDALQNARLYDAEWLSEIFGDDIYAMNKTTTTKNREEEDITTSSSLSSSNRSLPSSYLTPNRNSDPISSPDIDRVIQLGYSMFEWSNMKSSAKQTILLKSVRRPKNGIPEVWLTRSVGSDKSVNVYKDNEKRSKNRSFNPIRDSSSGSYSPSTSTSASASKRTNIPNSLMSKSKNRKDSYDKMFDDSLGIVTRNGYNKDVTYNYQQRIRNQYHPYHVWYDDIDYENTENTDDEKLKKNTGSDVRWSGTGSDEDEFDISYSLDTELNKLSSEKEKWKQAYASGRSGDMGRDREYEMSTVGFWPDRIEFRDMIMEEAKWRIDIAGDWSAPLVKAETKWRYNLYRNWLNFLDTGYDMDGFDSMTFDGDTDRNSNDGYDE